jgi:hypothetical protein
MGGTLSGALGFWGLGKKGEEEKAKRRGEPPAVSGGWRSVAVAGGGRPRATPPPPVQVALRDRKEKMICGFKGGRPSSPFIPAKRKGGRRIVMDGRDRPVESWARLGLGGRGAQAASAAYPSAAGPRAQAGARTRPWANFCLRAEREDVNNNVCQFVLIFLEAIVCIFSMYLISIQI